MFRLDEKARLLKEKVVNMHPEYNDGTDIWFVIPAVKVLAPMLQEYEWLVYSSEGEHNTRNKYGMIFFTNQRWIFVQSSWFSKKPFTDSLFYEDISTINYKYYGHFGSDVELTTHSGNKIRFGFSSGELFEEAIAYMKSQIKSNF